MKIGITSLLSRNPWKNRSKQSATNLYECLQNLGVEVFYICNDKNIINFDKDHKAFYEEDITKDAAPEMDILIIHGYQPEERTLEGLKRKNKDIKIIYHTLANPIAKVHELSRSSEDLLINHIDEIWLPPHQFGKRNFIGAIFPDKVNIKECPFLWSPSFLEEFQRKSKNPNIRYDSKRDRGISILEPNKDFTKNLVLPMSFAARAVGQSHGLFKNISIFNTKHAKKSGVVQRLYKDIKERLLKDVYLSNEWDAPDIYARCGQFIVSHQFENEVNYQYLESLFLDLPLIHNSKTLSSCGYYYKDNNPIHASSQIVNAGLNHAKNLNHYREESRKLILSYSPNLGSNMNKLAELINSK